jgi:hypothetical protein
MGQHGLRVHPEKSRLVECSQREQSFDFLGYRFNF